MGFIPSTHQAAAAKIIMSEAIKNGGVNTHEIYEGDRILKAIFDEILSPEEGELEEFGDPYDSIMFHELCIPIEHATDHLRALGWVVYENVTPSESGDQYTIKDTDEGLRNLEKASDDRSYESIIL